MPLPAAILGAVGCDSEDGTSFGVDGTSFGVDGTSFGVDGGLRRRVS